MKFEKEEDRLNFVIELLNHPELLWEVRCRNGWQNPVTRICTRNVGGTWKRASADRG